MLELRVSVGLRNGKFIYSLITVDGNWGPWTGTCSVTCGLGHQDRLRVCNSPAPSNGGADCTGEAEDHVVCTEKLCDEGEFYINKNVTLAMNCHDRCILSGPILQEPWMVAGLRGLRGIPVVGYVSTPEFEPVLILPRLMAA